MNLYVRSGGVDDCSPAGGRSNLERCFTVSSNSSHSNSRLALSSHGSNQSCGSLMSPETSPLTTSRESSSILR